jgi:serine/threonine protein kinase
MANRLPLMPPDISGLSYLSPLGRGGFADVFLYRQSVPSREVAVKVFLKKFQTNSPSAISFVAEANNLAKLGGHPNIVNIFEANISRDGNPYISMEYCPTSLGKNWRTNPLSLESVLDIGVQIACALETVHRSNLIHRDIKPSNILINSFGTPVLSDFGIAGEINVADTNDQIAMSLPWSAPEVVSLQTLGSVSSDIFSLGATLYSLLAGRTPFESSDPKQNDNDKLKARIVKAIYTPIPVGGIPRIVEELLNKAMYRDPALRFGSMQEFAMALNELQAALQFQVTRLSIAPSNVNRVEENLPKYPCGHVKVDTSGLKVGVYVTPAGGGRKKNLETALDPEQCPICAKADAFVPQKKKFKLGPLFWVIAGAVAFGYVLTYLLLSPPGV